eukprot:NP_505934.1 PMS (Post Meiotic Segregation) family [Caenorhabditis elegans]
MRNRWRVISKNQYDQNTRVLSFHRRQCSLLFSSVLTPELLKLYFNSTGCCQLVKCNSAVNRQFNRCWFDNYRYPRKE